MPAATLGAATVGVVVVSVEVPVPVPVPGVVGVLEGNDGLPPPPPQAAISNAVASTDKVALTPVFDFISILIPIFFLSAEITASNYGQ